MDPTDIVKVPYDLERLCMYVTFVVVFLGILATAPTQNYRKLSIPGLAVLTLTGHGVIVLCGASPVLNPWHTLAASLYTTALISFDPPIFVLSDDNKDDDKSTATSTSASSNNAGVSWFPQLQLLVRGTRPKQRQASSMQQRQDKVAMVTAHCVAACLIPCQILLLYDHGMQVQRWPVPTIMASSYGWAIGLIAGTLWAIRT
jgi:hypothetical protein